MAGLRRLAPAGDGLDPAAWVASLGLDAPLGHPRVVGVMVGSADGRAAVGGHSTPLSSPEDRGVLRAVRAHADVLLLGPSTLAIAGYGARMLDPEQQAAREAAGRPPLPLVATITRSGTLPDAPVLTDPAVRTLVFGPAGLRLPAPAASASPRGAVAAVGVEPAAVLASLGAEHGVGLVVCEGGPTLLGALAAADLIDDLVLTVAPLLVGGDEPRLLAGPPLRTPTPLRLEDVARAGDHLFLHLAR